MIWRIFKRVLRIATALAAGAVVIGLVWLLATDSGLAWTARRVESVTDGAVTIGATSGRLLGPIRAQDTTVTTQAGRLTVDALQLDWEPSALLALELDILRVRADGATWHRADAPPTSEPPAARGPPDIPDRLPVPLTVIVRDATVTDLALARPGEEPLTAERVALAGEVSAVRLELERFAVTAMGSRLEGSALLLADQPWDVRAEASGTLAGDGLPAARVALSADGTLHALDVDLRAGEPYAAQLEGRMAVLADALDWRASLTLAGTDLGAFPGELPAGRLTGRVNASGDAASAEIDARLDAALADGGAPAILRAGGDVTLADGRPAGSLRMAWRNLRWPALPGYASPEGSASLTGDPGAYRFAGRAAVRAPSPAPGADELAGSIELDGRGDPEVITLSSLAVHVPEGELTGSASWRWAERAVRADVRLTGIDPAALAPELAGEWPGRIDADLSASARLDPAAPAGRLTIHGLSGTLRGAPVSASGRAALQQERLTVQELELAWGGNRAAVSASLGEVALDGDIRLELDEPERLLADAGGRLALDASLAGTRERPRVAGSLRASGVTWRDAAVGALALDADVGLDRRESTLTLEARDLAWQDRALERLSASADGVLGDHRAELAVAGDLGAELAVAGGYDEDTAVWQGRLTRASLTDPGMPWRLDRPTGLRIGPDAIALERGCWQSDGDRFCLAARARSGQDWHVAVALDRLALARLAPLMPATVELEGAVDGEAEVTARPEAGYFADFTVRSERGRVDRLAAGEDESTEVLAYEDLRLAGELDEDGLDARLDTALGGGGELRASAALPGYRAQALPALDQPVRSGLRLRTDNLRIAEMIVPEAANVRGELTAELSTAGTMTAPELYGSARLAEGALEVPLAGIRVTEIAAELDARGSDRLDLDAAARSDDGRVRLAGRVRPSTSGPMVDASLVGERFQVMDTADARVSVSPDLALHVEGQRVDLTGELAVPEAKITPADLSQAVKPSDDTVIEGGEPEERDQEPGSPYRVFTDVSLALGESVRFKGFGFKGDLAGRLRVVERPGQPTIGNGELRVENGTYRYLGQTLEIEAGRLLFTGGPLANPGLDIRAARTVEDVRAGLHITGTLRQPIFNVFSEPAMAETQALSYVLMGRPLRRTSDEEADQVDAAAEALGLKGTELLAKQLGKQMGLDDVSIETDGGVSDAALVVGRKLSPRLYVSYGVGLLDAAQTLRTRYELSRHWSLRTESGDVQAIDLFFEINR